MNLGFTRRMSLTVLLLSVVSSAWAVLPAFDSDGRQLPSLSPLIKEVGPSVVYYPDYASKSAAKRSFFSSVF
jgi:hypothetical protein